MRFDHGPILTAACDRSPGGHYWMIIPNYSHLPDQLRVPLTRLLSSYQSLCRLDAEKTFGDGRLSESVPYSCRATLSPTGLRQEFASRGSSSDSTPPTAQSPLCHCHGGCKSQASLENLQQLRILISAQARIRPSVPRIASATCSLRSIPSLRNSR